MLAALEGHHGRLAAAMDAMRVLVASDAPEMALVSRTRLALGKESAARTQFLAAVVYPALLGSLSDEPALASVRALRRDAADDRARSSLHVGKWNARTIEADWDGFRRDARAILAMMAARNARERDVLVPLLRRQPSR